LAVGDESNRTVVAAGVFLRDASGTVMVSPGMRKQRVEEQSHLERARTMTTAR